MSSGFAYSESIGSMENGMVTEIKFKDKGAERIIYMTMNTMW